MDNYLTEQQVEELVNFDSVEQDLMDLIEDNKSSLWKNTLTLTSTTDYELRNCPPLNCRNCAKRGNVKVLHTPKNNKNDMMNCVKCDG